MQFAEAKSLEVILNEIVARVRQFTNADGAAIAMRDGDFVVTRATTGGIAPDHGARMSIRGSFTGLCLEQRTVLHCEDSDSDARVDPKVCRQLKTRSFVVVPIEGDKQSQGVLAAFSSSAHAFTRTDIAVLKTAADQIVRALTNPYAETTPESSLPVERKVEKQTDEAPKQIQPVVVKVEAPKQVQSAAIEETPAVAKAATAGAAPSPVRYAVPVRVPEQRSVSATPARVNVPSNVVPITKPREPEALVSLAESIGTPARTETPTRKIDDDSREQHPEWKGFEGHEDSPRSAVKWFLLAAVACALLVGGLSYLMRRPLTLRDNAAAKFNNSDVRATESNTQAAAEPARAAASAPVAFAATKTSLAFDPAATAPLATKEKNATVVKPPAMVVDSSSTAKPRTPEVPDAEAPQVTIASSNASLLPETKPAMPGAPKPPPPVRQSDFQPSALISKVMPQFPRSTTAAAGVQTVVLHALVLADGTVGEVRSIQGRAEFAESAKTALKQWRYKPAHMDGKAVESSINVTLNFKR